MRPTRRTQPYRRGVREPGPSLDAILKGSPFYLPNPMDLPRIIERRRRRRMRRGR